MKRALLIVMALTLLLPAPAAQAAGRRNAKPRAHVAITPVGLNSETGQMDHLIRVDAADADGRINEIAIDFGDGVVVFLLLLCDPETQPPGTSVTQEITWGYSPGHYVVRAVAYSTPDCFSAPIQESPPAVRPLNLR